jgi:hypothetical protein
MARNFLMTRRNFAAEDGAYFYGNGVWNFRENMLDVRPQVVAESVENRDWSATQFSMDLGAIRRVGLIYLINLRCTSLGVLEVSAGMDSSFTSNNYHTVTTCWPPDEADPFDYNAWHELALTHVYMPDEHEKLGYPRILIPPAAFDCRYIRVEIRDSTADSPIQIGCFGACEVWEAPINFEFGWSITMLDNSDVQSVPWGTVQVQERGIRRRLNVGFQANDENDFWVRPFGVSLIKGKSSHLVAAPLSDAEFTPRFEKAAVYGLISSESQLSNPFIGYWALPFQVDQSI